MRNPALPAEYIQYAVLQSELKRTERLCEILDERIKELNVTEDAGALNISILEVAQVEDKPSKPQRAKILAIALMVGLLFGCGAALLRDWLDYRLRSVDEICFLQMVMNYTLSGKTPFEQEGLKKR